MPLSDEELKALWTNPEFKGSFSGATTFASAVFDDYGEIISMDRITKVLETIDNYVEQLRQRKRFPRRTYDFVHGYCSLAQADLADFSKTPSNGYSYVLVYIDVYSRKILVSLLRSKSAEETRQGFIKILGELHDHPDVLQTDGGTEFVGNKQFFKAEKIYWKIMYGQNKASFAEMAVGLLKRRIFTTIRYQRSKEWSRVVEQTVQNYNNTRSVYTGVAPALIVDRPSGIIIDKNIGLHLLPNPEEQLENQANYLKQNAKKKLVVGDFVYVDEKEEAFDKSYHRRRLVIEEVVEVLARLTPPMFRLRDLNKKLDPRLYYSYELRKTSKNPEEKEFEIDDVLEEKTVRGKKYYYVSWLGYPRSFDSWIPKENIVHGIDTDTTVVNKGTARGKKGLENPPAGAPVPKKRKGKRRRKF